MLDFAIFALTVIIFLIVAVIYLYPGSKRTTTIPGPDITDPLEGNLPELAASGSLHEFLRDLHEHYGPITAFWLGPKFCVSIASPELLKEQANTFDRPKELFALFEPLITPYSIQYANGTDGRKRHGAYSRCFTHEALQKRYHNMQKELFVLFEPLITQYSIEYANRADGFKRHNAYLRCFSYGALQKRYHIIQKLSAEVCTKLAGLAPEEHIAISEHVYPYAIKTMLDVSFGSYFSSDKEVFKFKNAYDITWSEMESRLVGDPPDAKREKNFEKYKGVLNKMLHEALDHCNENDLENDMFIKVVQEVNESPDIIKADMLSLCIGGFHTTALLLYWSLYFMASNPDVQEKVYAELKDLVGDEAIPFEAISRLTYMRQVLEETLRCSVLAPYAARVQDIDIVLGGHNVPAGTPVVQALGVMLEDEKVFPDSDKFDPERFSAENKKKIPSCAFEPFGFAGKRKCPGFRLAYLEASLLLGDLVRKFKVKMVEGQVVQPVYGLVTKPKEEIWITVEKRK